jgi:hypothetical protein
MIRTSICGECSNKGGGSGEGESGRSSTRCFVLDGQVSSTVCDKTTLAYGSRENLANLLTKIPVSLLQLVSSLANRVTRLPWRTGRRRISLIY